MDIVEVSSVLLVIQEIFYFYSNDPKWVHRHFLEVAEDLFGSI